MDIRVAIIEDDSNCQAQMKHWLLMYANKKGFTLSISQYYSAEAFLQTDHPYDIVFMDIDLPSIDGLSCAREFRKKNRWAALVFVTNMAQLAIRGYEVAALDFIVKPLLYSDFIFKLRRIFSSAAKHNQALLCVPTPNGMHRFAINDLLYIEVCDHRLIYHLKNGSFNVYGKLSAAEEKLASHGFLKCNRCFLVNPTHIHSIQGNIVTVGNTELQISRPQKKLFCKQLNEWLNSEEN